MSKYLVISPNAVVLLMQQVHIDHLACPFSFRQNSSTVRLNTANCLHEAAVFHTHSKQAT